MAELRGGFVFDSLDEPDIEPYYFVPRDTCTPSCGTSIFEDWAHTPLCEQRADALFAAQADQRFWPDDIDGLPY